MSTDQNTARRRLAFRKSYSQEHSSWRRRSLIEDARFDTVANAEFERQELTNQVKEDNEEPLVENGDTKEEPTKTCIIFSVKEMDNLSKVFRVFENCGASIQHVETRKSLGNSVQSECFVSCLATRAACQNVVKSLKQSSPVSDVTIAGGSNNNKKVTWFPRHISDLDNCVHLLTMYNPDLDQDHPGFSDKAYRARRKQIADIAFEYKHGQPIPRVEYTIEEIQTWGHAFRQIESLLDTHACKEYAENFRVLQSECGYSENSIPQLEDVSNFLHKRSGFRLRPVAGLLSARDFLASLAFRVFQSTQYVRHPSKPDHTVEPDCVHELLGHVPMLGDPGFAQFSQEIGLASLGASDEDIEKFSTLYWFSVEFGLCEQGGETRAYGAALLSSYGELKYALSGEPVLKPFVPAVTALQEYQDQEFQPIYFVTDSFEKMKEEMRDYAGTIWRPFEVRYEPYTESVHVLNSRDAVDEVARALRSDLNSVINALRRMDALAMV